MTECKHEKTELIGYRIPVYNGHLDGQINKIIRCLNDDCSAIHLYGGEEPFLWYKMQPPKDAPASEPNDKGSEGSDAKGYKCEHKKVNVIKETGEAYCDYCGIDMHIKFIPKESEPNIDAEVVGDSPKG